MSCRTGRTVRSGFLQRTRGMRATAGQVSSGSNRWALVLQPPIINWIPLPVEKSQARIKVLLQHPSATGRQLGRTSRHRRCRPNT